MFMNAEWSTLKSKMKAYLCPPGCGVYTVNTAKERKESLHKTLYGTIENIDNKWQDNLDSILENNKAALLGVCSDTGGGILRGANWGPLFLREALLKQDKNLDVLDLGDIRVIPHLLHDKYLNSKTINNCKKALYGDENSELPVSSLSITEDFVTQFYETFPKKGIFAIGGDHSVSYPLTKAYLKAKKKQNKKAAIIHFDAHTDLLVERLGIDICFGSWATHILDELNSPAHLIQIGIRSTGKTKEHWQSTFGVQQYWAKDVEKRGASEIAQEILDYLIKENIDELYVSFDIDAIDSKYASATGTPEPEGLEPHEAMLIIKALNEKLPITGADMVEIAPFLNTNQGDTVEPDTTLSVGASISAYLIEAINNANS
jgi:agmatinase